MQQKCFRKDILDILYNIQILYQNEQIDTETKNELCLLVNKCLSNDKFVKELSSKLQILKRNVDIGFKDLIIETLDKIN